MSFKKSEIGGIIENMKTAIYSFIQKHSLINPYDTIIVALSGGPDSVFLAHILNELKDKLQIKLIAAYLDHGWRSDTHEDSAFCQTLCTQWNIPFESAHVRDLDFKPVKKGSLEDEGRAFRRFYFNQLCIKYNAQAIALGHHQDDQLETFLIRLARGASFSGLCGIRPHTKNQIRPLLGTPKQAILDYLKEHAIPYRLDSSNESEKFLRNRIRKIAIPALEQCDSRIKDNALRSLHHLQEAYEALVPSIEQKAVAIISKRNYNSSNSGIIDTIALGKEQSFFQRELVARWLIENKFPCTLSESLINEILRFLCSPRGGVHQVHKNWSLVKKNNKVYIINKEL